MRLTNFLKTLSFFIIFIMTSLLACFEAKIYLIFLFTNHLCLWIFPKSSAGSTSSITRFSLSHLYFSRSNIDFIAILQVLIFRLSFVNLLCFSSGGIFPLITLKIIFGLTLVSVVSWVWLSGEFGFFFWALFFDKLIIWFSLLSASPLFWLALESGITSTSIVILWLKLGVSCGSVSSLLSVLFSVSASVLDLVSLFLSGLLLSSEFSVFSYCVAWYTLYSIFS